MTPKTISRDIKFISDSLCRPSSLKLLFRASEHQFRAKAFHSKCDGINDTFVLVRTEFGRTIAGYSGYTWEAKEDKKGVKEKNYRGAYVTDSSRRAFLLLMEQQQKAVPQFDKQIIVCDNRYGPCFGGYFGFGALKIGDNCNRKANSTTIDIGGHYNTEGTDRKYIWDSQ